MTIDRHHLLECILWPNGDGTFSKIVNTWKRLDKLGVYDDWKLIIPIEHGVHASMHKQFKEGTEYGQSGDKNPMYGMYGDKNPMYGKGHLVAGEKNGMYGQSWDKSPTWKGDKARVPGLYVRAKKLFKAGEITEEEFQPYRDAWAEDQRLRRKKRKQSSLLP